MRDSGEFCLSVVNRKAGRQAGRLPKDINASITIKQSLKRTQIKSVIALWTLGWLCDVRVPSLLQQHLPFPSIISCFI